MKSSEQPFQEQSHFRDGGNGDSEMLSHQPQVTQRAGVGVYVLVRSSAPSPVLIPREDAAGCLEPLRTKGLSRQGRVSSLWDDVAAALSECLVCGLSASFQPEDYSLILPTDALEQKGRVNPQSGYGAKKSRGCVCQGKHGHLKVSFCLFIFCFCL